MSRMSEIYPDSPGFKASGPSEQAAEKVASHAKVLRAKVLGTFKDKPSGLTADEVATELNLSALSVRPRVSELRRNGEIEDAGQRRRNASGLNATVWRYVPPAPPQVMVP